MNGELTAIPVLEGSLSGGSALTGVISEIPIIYGTLSEVVAFPPYTGDYRITPLVDYDITLKTENRVLKEDMVVKKIPVHEVPNPTGTTIYIGSEV